MPEIEKAPVRAWTFVEMISVPFFCTTTQDMHHYWCYWA